MMPFKDRMQKRTGSSVGNMDSTVARWPAVGMRPHNISFPIVLAHVYKLLSPLPPKLKRKRAVSNLRSRSMDKDGEAKRISAPEAVSDAQGPSPRPLLTVPANIGRRGPFPSGVPDPLRSNPPVLVRKPKRSKSRKRRGTVFTREEKKFLEMALPAIMEEADIERLIYELEAPTQAGLSNISGVYELEGTPNPDSLSSGSVYELEATVSQANLNELEACSEWVYELEGTVSQDSLSDIGMSSGSLYELEATTSGSDSSEISLPSVVFSDFEPLIESNRRLAEENRHMSVFIQEIVTKEIIIKEELARATNERKASEAALNLLWNLVKANFDGSEDVATPAQITRFLSTKEFIDKPRQISVNSNKKTMNSNNNKVKSITNHSTSQRQHRSILLKSDSEDEASDTSLFDDKKQVVEDVKTIGMVQSSEG
ncbi:hypothetical protein KVR01_002751 [Diaporthe batatas]|uniref:uncharacterized protein n=1 Tax=Diaporthe batatas TaxID=748121 RepID=UPI001D043FD8|nr:uncharacterized protein KVR01_002751 [Diaporthe batatas]KAG8167062.1 hypothetical protein KVR01_002751 [Diaporthe batatas]